MPIKYEQRAEILFSSLLRGWSLREWIDHRIANLFTKAQQYYPPVRLDDPLLCKILRVDRITVKKQIAERARLGIGKQGFEIVTRPYTYRYSGWKNYRIAHEIAHIFFYDIRQWPPRSMIVLKPGDKTLELTCDLIARSLLMPTKWVRDCAAENISLSASVRTQAHTLVHMATTFDVPFTLAARRLVNDLSILNIVVLRLVHTVDKKSTPSRRTSSWRVAWHAKPMHANDVLYIPWGRSTPTHRVLPKCSKAVHELLEDSIHSHQKTNSMDLSVASTVFRSSSFGNLAKNLESHYSDRLIPLHLKFLSDVPPDLFLPDDDVLPINVCDIFIPLL